MKDTWDTRMAKLRLSADSFVRQQEVHAKVGQGLTLPGSPLPWGASGLRDQLLGKGWLGAWLVLACGCVTGGLGL